MSDRKQLSGGDKLINEKEFSEDGHHKVLRIGRGSTGLAYQLTSDEAAASSFLFTLSFVE